MVFLDQEGVVEADAVVLAAAAEHGVFLAGAQAGKGFSGVEDGDLAAGHGIRVAAGGGGGTHQGLQEIQGSALAGENLAGIAAQSAQSGFGWEAVAILDMPFNVHVAQLLKHFVGPGGAAHDGVFAGNDGGGAAAVRVDELGGDIAIADIFFQSKGHIAGDVVTNIVGQVGAEGHGISEYGYRSRPRAPSSNAGGGGA